MIFDFGNTTVDIDVNATREYYSQHKPINDCDCTGCKNFRRAILNVGDKVKETFKSFGIDDMRYITEIIPWVNVNSHDSRNGLFWYQGFFHVKGKVVKEDKNVPKGEEGIFIDNNFKIFSGTGNALPPENFPQPVLLIETDAYLPWVIDDENDYDSIDVNK